MALLIAILSLMAFVLRPSYSTHAGSEGVIVLTPGYNPSTADSLIKIYPESRVLITPDVAGSASGQQLENLNQLLEYQNQIRFVLGTGLPAYVLPDSGFNFLQGQLPKGITQLQVPASIVANRKATLYGEWNGEATNLTLIGPEGRIDSVAAKSGAFQLSFTPKQPGKYLYELEAGGKSEMLPLEIQAPQPLDVLILQNYPSAEIRYLKNFLIDQDHRVIVRTQISKNTFRYEYGNRGPVSLTRVTSDLLNGFDLLILANESAGSDVTAIREAVRNGLGVLWLPAESELAKPPFGFVFTKVATDTARLPFEAQVLPLPAWPVTSKDFSILANKNRVLSGYKMEGAGKVGYQLLTETYPLIGKGQSRFYNHLWTEVIEKLARLSTQSTSVKIKNPFPMYPNEPLTIEILSSLPEPEVYLDNIRLPLRGHAIIDGYGSTTGWPKEKGWHQVLSATDSAAHNFFVSEANTWAALRAANLQKSTKARAGGVLKSGKDILIHRSVEPLWFFVLFVLSIGFVWLAPKL
ncbi:MAG: hypothetical protein DYG99_01630 [Bacteroidetes bacterium CHB5]|nr:hypothetical protein [Bacteroidetes bacterium CHB5]